MQGKEGKTGERPAGIPLQEQLDAYLILQGRTWITRKRMRSWSLKCKAKDARGPEGDQFQFRSWSSQEIGDVPEVQGWVGWRLSFDVGWWACCQLKHWCWNHRGWNWKRQLRTIPKHEQRRPAQSKAEIQPTYQKPWKHRWNRQRLGFPQGMQLIQLWCPNSTSNHQQTVYPIALHFLHGHHCHPSPSQCLHFLQRPPDISTIRPQKVFC